MDLKELMQMFKEAGWSGIVYPDDESANKAMFGNAETWEVEADYDPPNPNTIGVDVEDLACGTYVPDGKDWWKRKGRR